MSTGTKASRAIVVDMERLCPSDVVHERRLSDGRRVLIRPVRAQDANLEADFINRLSGESRYFRFQKWLRKASDSLIHFLTDVDNDRHFALVCIAWENGAERLVGEARYVIDADGASCDFGIVIADDWHTTGVAGLLMAALIHAARDRGLTRMESQVMAANTAMLRFARGLGFTIEHVPGDLTSVRIVKDLRVKIPQAAAV